LREFIDAAAFKDMILCAEAALNANIRIINELNVFPVPDGDTGTNMGLTFGSAAAELRKRSCSTVSEVADVSASAMLRGARGNSGVILSLLFRGISRRLKGLETADAAALSEALSDGVEAAYKAVMKPAEGTILTVSRMAAKAGAEAAAAGASLESVLACAVKEGEDALEETVNQNPVLKKAGVVDAGGKGYVVILAAMLASLRGEAVAPTEALPEIKEEDTPFNVFTDEDITFAFDTVYIVRKNEPDVDLDPLREYLNSVGDSLVISEDDEIFKVHVHTDTPGEVLTESCKYGVLELAKIENMVIQAQMQRKGEKPIDTDMLYKVEEELEAMEEEEPEIAEPEKEFGIVTVCAGKGMEELFRELGADRVVTGGQTMNPSTDDILKEINKTPASTVFVFPNNKNIIMAAQQCQPLTEKKVVVMPSKTVPQGISALMNFTTDDTEENIVAAMEEAMGNVHTAMITYAARDSEFDGRDIHEGEYLALMDGALLDSYKDIKVVFEKLAAAAEKYSPEFINVYYGEDVTEDEANEASAPLSELFPDAEISVIGGGQPVYYYMISIE